MTIEQIYERFLESSGASTDTRKINPDCMFFALKGDNFNGNEYAKEAIDKGAKYCIVDDPAIEHGKQMIVVNDVLETLQKLATFHRKYLQLPIIALTGSNGKTTTKELINSVLSTSFKTTATKGNLNNHIGVPLTLLSMTKETELGIVEMGANHLREIQLLCNIALPDYGLITNFGKAHLEGFGGVEGVIKGKSELYDHLKSHDKVIIVNADDSEQLKQVGDYDNIWTFGETGHFNVNVKMASTTDTISVAYEGRIIKSNLTGIYNFSNIAVAISIASYFKIDVNAIKMGIEGYIPANNRSQLIDLAGTKILLDAYNANPTSMVAALKNLDVQKAERKAVILGDMFELGPESKAEHQAIVDFLEELTIDRVILVGKHFYATNLLSKNMTKFEDFELLKKQIKISDLNAEFILIKGSRGMALERLLANDELS